MRRKMALAGSRRAFSSRAQTTRWRYWGRRGYQSAEGFGDHVVFGAEGDRVDYHVDDRGRVTVIVVGTHRATWQALAFPEGDAPGVAAGGALGGLLDAERAVPVLALLLEAPQTLSALGADRRRDWTSI